MTFPFAQLRSARLRTRQSHPPADDPDPATLAAPELLRAQGVELERGLTDDEASARRERWGPNTLEEAQQRGALQILLAQFRSLVVLLLLAAAALSAAFGQQLEAAAIVAALVINAALGFVTELKATRAVAALRQLVGSEATVRRAGRERRVAQSELVPGDVVLLSEGDVVPADLRLCQVQGLLADESTLTGESLPVEKQTEPLPADTPLAERSNLVFRGTSITRGEGLGVVVATGMRTELGKIAALVASSGADPTPLERRLEQLGNRLIWLVLAIGLALAVGGILAGRDVFTMVETSIVLAIAAVPEGLPIVATVALARGTWRMARRNALVNRLSAVETLGGTSVILSDKTGTLTENRLVVARAVLGAGELRLDGEGSPSGADAAACAGAARDDLAALLRAATLCSNAVLPDGEHPGRGDPLEVALLRCCAARGVLRPALLRALPEAREESFSAHTKAMATYHACEGRYLVAVKGAPEAVLAACTRARHEGAERPLERAWWEQHNRALAGDGLRVLALAEKRVTDLGAPPYEDLTLLGLVALHDPPRSDVQRALRDCRAAGIRVVMVTGDQPATAHAVAHRLGIADGPAEAVVTGRDLAAGKASLADGVETGIEAGIYARVTPEQKLHLVQAFRRAGHVVAMTGDGVNDAPALREADVGVAMGGRGTQVAREAADVVLKDDAFPTIVAAVAEGRVIFSNIRRAIVYLLSGNLGEILAVAGAAALGASLPLLPLQILFVNLLFDVFPALALALGDGDDHVLEAPPRPAEEPILTRAHWLEIGGYGVVIGLAVLAALLVAERGLGLPPAQAVTVSFLGFGLARLLHLFNMRDPAEGCLRNALTRNPYAWTAAALCAALLAATQWAPLGRLLHVRPLPPAAWLTVLAAGLLPLVVGQLALRARRRPGDGPYAADQRTAAHTGR